MNPLQILAGFALAALIAAASYRLGALSVSGAWAAVVVGGMTFGLGGPVAAVLMVLFFISSSLLSRLGQRRKRELLGVFAKGHRRDHAQVLANGGVAAVMAAVYGLAGGGIWLAGISGTLAAANADTWATEIGVLNKSWPRLIHSGKKVPPGTSGAISTLGSLATTAGALLIGLIAWALSGEKRLALAALLGGVAGSFLDSLLGATVQAAFHCPKCDKDTERHPVHTCGETTAHIRGWRWLTNDEVNFAATVTGALIGAGVWFLPG